MRYAEPESFRAALEGRLRQASDSQQDLARRRRSVAFDRVLSRLAAVNGGRWVLKGGAALEFRMPDRARATRDIDLADLHAATIADAVDDVTEAISENPHDDHFRFQVTGHRQLALGLDRGPAVRLSVDARIGRRVFEKFVVDVVMGPEGLPPPDVLRLGGVVSFAGVPEVEVQVIDLRTHWAEKLSAYCQRYGDRPNTRVKDLVDLVLLIGQGLDPDTDLLDTVNRTFNSRGQNVPGAEIPSMAAEWADQFQELAAGLGLLAATSVDAHALVEDFWRRALGAGRIAVSDEFDQTAD